MGNYLNKPITHKNSLDGYETDFPFRWGLSEMQGWRISMEDSYIINFNLNQNAHIIGVYDGHGGSHVSRYVARNISSILQTYIEYYNNNYLKALQSSYLNLDSALISNDSQDELCHYMISKSVKCNVYSNSKQCPTPLSTTTVKLIDPSKVLSTNSKSTFSSHPSGTDNDKAITIKREISVDNMTDTHSSNTSEATQNEIFSDQAIYHPSDSLDKVSFDSDTPTTLLEYNSYSKNTSPLHKKSKFSSELSKKCPTNISNEGQKIGHTKWAQNTKTLLGKLGYNFIVKTRNFLLKKYYRLSSNAPSFAFTTGCTAVTCLITKDCYVVANVGDSRCILCRGNKAIELTQDHKPDLEQEKTRIVSAGGFLESGRVNGNLNLSRAIGDLFYKQNSSLPPDKQIISAFPDVTITNISDEDEFLILGCDGLWENLTSQKVVDYILERISSRRSLSSILENLYEVIISPDPEIIEHGCDNMTGIIIDLKSNRLIK